MLDSGSKTQGETQATLSQAREENLNVKKKLSQCEVMITYLMEELHRREEARCRADSDHTLQVGELAVLRERAEESVSGSTEKGGRGRKS